MTRESQPNFKRDKLITENESRKILAIYTRYKNKTFGAQELTDRYNMSHSALQRYLWIGKVLDIFIFVIRSKGNQPALYACNPNVDAFEVLKKHTVKSQLQVKSRKMAWKDTPCLLANILGMKPVSHDVKPRKIEGKGGSHARARQRTYPTGGWMVGA